jgi:hypothetical protein
MDDEKVAQLVFFGIVANSLLLMSIFIIAWECYIVKRLPPVNAQ